MLFYCQRQISVSIISGLLTNHLIFKMSENTIPITGSHSLKVKDRTLTVTRYHTRPSASQTKTNVRIVPQ